MYARTCYRLSDYGKFVGIRLLDLIVLREKSYKRDVKLLNILIFIKSTVWKSLFGEALVQRLFFYVYNATMQAKKLISWSEATTTHANVRFKP